MVMIPPRGFGQAMVALLTIFGLLLFITIKSGMMPPERVEEVRQLVYFWE